MVDCLPSRFIDEVPQEDLVIEGLERNQDQNKARGKATLNSLKSLLDSF
jgi:ATP-dependent DNA helicase Rep